MRAVVVENLAARTAGAGITHHPEIIGGVFGALVVTDADNFFFWHADLVGPNIVCLIIIRIDGDEQFFLRQFINFREQFPGKLNRFALEIIAEAEVAQHFEKRVVPCGIADVFQIVMFAPGAHATLRGNRPDIAALFNTQETVFELVHAGVGKQQRGIVARYQ